MDNNKHRVLPFICLHVLLMLVSVGDIFSKLAGAEPFLSLKFCLFYGAMIAILGLYAIAWQQILRIVPLVTAYANNAVSVLWGLIWGALLFQEQVTLTKLIGCAIVIFGVYVFVTGEAQE